MAIDQHTSASKQYSTFSIKEVMKEAWGKVYGSKKTFLISLIIYLAIYLSLYALKELFFKNIASEIILSILSSLFNAGFVYLGLRKAFDKSISVDMLFQAFKLKLGVKVVVAQFLVTLIAILAALIIALPIIFIFTPLAKSPDTNLPMIVGMTLGGILAFYFLIKFTLTNLIIMAQQLGPIKAIATSFKSTKGNFWRLVGLGLLTLLIVLASVLTVGIGFIWSFPFITILWAVVYKKLVGEKFLDN